MEQDAEHWLSLIGQNSYQLFGGAPNPHWIQEVVTLPNGAMCIGAIGLQEPTSGEAVVIMAVREPGGVRSIEVHSFEKQCSRECYSRKVEYTHDLVALSVTITTRLGASATTQQALDLHLPSEYWLIASLLGKLWQHGGAYDMVRVAELLGEGSRFGPPRMGHEFTAFLTADHSIQHPDLREYLLRLKRTASNTPPS